MMRYNKRTLTWSVDKKTAENIHTASDLRKFFDYYDQMAINQMTYEFFENEVWTVTYSWPIAEQDRLNQLTMEM